MAQVDRASQICDSALGGRLNLLLPVTSSDTDDVRHLLRAFDPDAIVADTPTLPTSAARLRLPTVPLDHARTGCFPLGLVSNLREFTDLSRLLVAHPDAARHVRLNVGCGSDESLHTFTEQFPEVAIQQTSLAADFLPTLPKDRWCRLAGPLGLYGWSQWAGEEVSEAERVPKDGRTVIVSGADDLRAICFFWNFRASYPDTDIVWLPLEEATARVAEGTSCWIWFPSAGEPPSTATPVLRPSGYFFRRYGAQIWSQYSSTQPADVGRHYLTGTDSTNCMKSNSTRLTLAKTRPS